MPVAAALAPYARNPLRRNFSPVEGNFRVSTSLLSLDIAYLHSIYSLESLRAVKVSQIAQAKGEKAV